MGRNGFEQPSRVWEPSQVRPDRWRELLRHLVAYVVINAALWAIWLVSGAGYAWPAWVTVPWAIGIVLNAWSPVSETDAQREIERMHPRTDMGRSVRHRPRASSRP